MMKSNVKRKDNILKKFIVLISILLCLFFLFCGVAFAGSNTERSLKGTQNKKIDETVLIREAENGISEFFALFK